MDEWMQSFTLQLMADDVDKWCKQLENPDVTGRFAVGHRKRPPCTPGPRIANAALPAGALWHIAGRLDGAAA